MNAWVRRSVAVMALVLTTSSAFAAQPVAERNVRAQMQFLAGDAMQGRGSGTAFERVAAEYIGSQFMQFGLLPVGDRDAAGNLTYVQSVVVPGKNVLDSLPFTGILANAVQYRRNIVALTLSGAPISGPLQKLKLGDTPTKGSVAFVDVPASIAMADLMPKAMAMGVQGASAVILRVSDAVKERWSDLAGRQVTAQKDGSNLLFVTDEVADAMAKLADGTTIGVTPHFVQEPDGQTWNAVGKIEGTDPKLKAQVILLSSHLDHLGMNPSVPVQDKIFNGADDDASGTVAVLEMARALAGGKAPKRTVYFVCFGSEEVGGHGARYFGKNLPFDKKDFVANIEFEMIGRPDPKVSPDQLWLTGYDLSTLGPELARRGAKLVSDPHPEQHFFERSDNINFARQGIIAHTVSSYGMHSDYHHVSDSMDRIDFKHMTHSIDSMVRPIEWLVNSDYVPTWLPGKSPAAMP